MRQIAANAGYEGSLVVQRVKEGKKSFGFNAESGEYVDMLEAGVVDPKKVVRIALQNASSIAALLLTTESLVSEMPEDEHAETAYQLSGTQNGFRKRMDKVVVRIKELPDAEADFAKELGLLTQVSGVMVEATETLAKPETGSPALAVETEIIELLLQSKLCAQPGTSHGLPYLPQSTSHSSEIPLRLQSTGAGASGPSHSSGTPFWFSSGQ